MDVGGGWGFPLNHAKESIHFSEGKREIKRRPPIDDVIDVLI